MNKVNYILTLVFLFSCCSSTATQNDRELTDNNDLLILKNMIHVREKAMINKNINIVMSQFNENITWINSQGYFFEGKQNVLEFHNMLANSKTLDYFYEAGEPKIRIIGPNNAIAYYSWRMYWFNKGHQEEIKKKEIGLMTLSAQKKDGKWYWIAVTNQHTPWFYETIDAVTIDE